MATIYARSRYLQTSPILVPVYDSEDTDGTEPVRHDKVWARRFTTFADFGGTFPHTVQLGETMEDIARYYYNDSTLWWILADFNTHIFNPQDLAQGDVLRVPKTEFVGSITATRR